MTKWELITGNRSVKMTGIGDDSRISRGLMEENINRDVLLPDAYDKNG